jgi:hypothetical protein
MRGLQRIRQKNDGLTQVNLKRARRSTSVVGLVASLSRPEEFESMARPGGNATGFTPFEYSLSGKV